MGTEQEYRYNVFFEREGDIYVATVPALNFSSTYGKTLEEARANVREMVQVYLESLWEDGLDLPEPDAQGEVIAERIAVAIP
jgi:predicted RNase H-like HicB family nuclease